MNQAKACDKIRAENTCARRPARQGSRAKLIGCCLTAGRRIPLHGTYEKLGFLPTGRTPNEGEAELELKLNEEGRGCT